MPAMEHLPEFKALEDEGRRSAFAKYIKRQKVRHSFYTVLAVLTSIIKERMREASEDGGSASGRRRKDPARDYRDDRDYERSRDYERGSGKYDYRGGYRDKDYREKDRDSYGHRTTRHGRDSERDERRRGSRSWEDGSHTEREKRELPHDEKGDDRVEKVQSIPTLRGDRC
jgi:pre-mRNA-processing factor 40